MSDLLDLARAVGVTNAHADEEPLPELERDERGPDLGVIEAGILGLLFIIIVWMWFACPIH